MVAKMTYSWFQILLKIIQNDLKVMSMSYVAWKRFQKCSKNVFDHRWIHFCCTEFLNWGLNFNTPFLKSLFLIAIETKRSTVHVSCSEMTQSATVFWHLNRIAQVCTVSCWCEPSDRRIGEAPSRRLWQRLGSDRKCRARQQKAVFVEIKAKSQQRLRWVGSTVRESCGEPKLDSNRGRGRRGTWADRFIFCFNSREWRDVFSTYFKLFIYLTPVDGQKEKPSRACDAPHTLENIKAWTTMETTLLFFLDLCF